jgi:exopolyphosphatase/guanosine-5'-triphosphate,3'-diphosphate pyrophosphatase
LKNVGPFVINKNHFSILKSYPAGVLKKAGAIDVGSNTLRLLIAQIEGNQVFPVCRDREMVRLGRNFFPERVIGRQSLESALKVLERFQRAGVQEGVARFRAVGTGILRLSTNIHQFLEAVRRATGIAIEIVSGEEEARLSALGVLSVFQDITVPTCIFDLGGGSVEFTWVQSGIVRKTVSLPLGAVGLTEQFLFSDPPLKQEIVRLGGHCLDTLRERININESVGYLIGTAGTVTTLTAMDKKLTEYDSSRINGSVLDRDTLNRLLFELTAIPLATRQALPGLEPGRADIITAGLVAVLSILDFFEVDTLRVCDAGLLEGLLLDETATYS